MRTRTIKQLLIGLFLIVGLCAKAQIYPATSNLVLSPPYPMNIGTYAQDDFMGLHLNIILADENHINYLVGLRLVIEGQAGTRIETTPSEMWQHTIYLNPGNNTVDISVLHSLFAPENLFFSGIENSVQLPEGMYRFKVEVYDPVRNALISDPYSGMHMCWISRFEPPILTFPANDQVIAIPAENATTSAMFSWVPRGVYPGITNVEYTLEITEIYDENIAPEELFALGTNDPMTFSVSTNLTSKSLMFPTEFIGMQPDKWYAWRVRSHDLSGKIFYRNAGYSEIRKFFYGTPCDAPNALTAASLNENSVQLTWDGYLDTTNYLLQLRNKTNWGNWQDIESPVSGMEIASLQQGATYEFRLAIDCSNISSDFVYAEYNNPLGSNSDCYPPEELTTRIENSLLWGEKLNIDWETMPGALEYQVDVRCAARTLSKQTNNTWEDFRWGEQGIYGDTIWIRTASQCWEDSAFVFGIEKQIILNGGAGGVGCTALDGLIDSAVTYTSGITEVYWPADYVFKSYTLLWRPAGMSAPYQEVNTSLPPAIIQGIQDGDSVECRLVYHCNIDSDTAAITGFRTVQASGDDITTTGSCYEPSYLQAFVPSHTSMHLIWEPEPNAKTYEINWKMEGEYIWNIRQVDDKEIIIEDLEENATYEYRVRTVCEDGIGFSRWTSVGSVSLANLSMVNDGCPIPYYDKIGINSSQEAIINFPNDPVYTSYGAEYRIKTKMEWTEAVNRGMSVVFSNLSPETTYEVRTRGFCGINRSEYTLVDTFTTPELIPEDTLECGTDNYTSISNTTPIAELLPNNKILANGWVLYIKNVTETNGAYNGTAYSQVPYLKHSMVEFTLENAKINTDSTMFAGRAVLKGLNVQLIDPAIVAQIENLLNMAEQGLEETQTVIDELQAIVDMIPDLGGGAYGSDTTDFYLMDPNDLFDLGIADLTGAIDTLTDGLNNIIIARDLAQSGVNILALAVEKALANLMMGQELAPMDSCLVFVSDPVDDLGFDSYRYPGSEPQYTERRTIDEQFYYVPNKAIITNTDNKVKVVLPSDEISPDLVFRIDLENSIPYTDLNSTNDDGKALLELALTGAYDKVLAYDSIFFPAPDTNSVDTTIFMCVGELSVSSYDLKNKHIVLVPVNGASELDGVNVNNILAELRDSLNRYYAPANVNLSVSMYQSPTNSNSNNLVVNAIAEGMEDSDDRIITRFTSDMNLVIDAFEAEKDPEDDTFYMFLVNRSSKTSKEGYMPFQQRYGFLTVDGDKEKGAFIHTTAHELGHGAFNLRHPFSDKAHFPLAEGSTDNLMDYNEGINLFKYQWDLVDDPKFMLTWFMSEEEAAAKREDLYFTINSESTKYKHRDKYSILKARDTISIALNTIGTLLSDTAWVINGDTINPQKTKWIFESDTIQTASTFCKFPIDSKGKHKLYAYLENDTKLKLVIDVYSEYNYFVNNDTTRYKLTDKLYRMVNNDSLLLEVKSINGDIYNIRWERNGTVLADSTNKCKICINNEGAFDIQLYFDDGDEQELDVTIYAPPYMTFNERGGYNGEFLFDKSFMDMPNMRNTSFYDTINDPYRNVVYYAPVLGLPVGQNAQLDVSKLNFDSKMLNDPEFEIIIKASLPNLIRINGADSLVLNANNFNMLNTISIEALDTVQSLKIYAYTSSSNDKVGLIEYYCLPRKTVNATLIYVKLQGEASYPNFNHINFESYLNNNSMNQLFLEIDVDTVHFSSTLNQASFTGLNNITVIQRLEIDRNVMVLDRGIDHTYFYITNINRGNTGGFHALGDGYGLKTQFPGSAIGETENEICAHEFGHWQGFYHPFENAAQRTPPYNINLVNIQGGTLQYFMDYDIRRKKWFKYEMLQITR